MKRSRDEEVANIIHYFVVLTITLAFASETFKKIPNSQWWQIVVIPPTQEMLVKYGVLYSLSYPVGGKAKELLNNATKNKADN